MNYLKSLFFNFLTVFFANHVLPGINVTDQTKLPHVGGDLMFAIALGLLNSLIYPILKLIRQEVTILKLVLMALIINFASYGIISIIHIGIDVQNVKGYLLASCVVVLGSFLTNFMEMRHHKTELPQ